jgi:molybdopterin-guanine dinucleotide biosynthesis protein A
VNVSCAVLAGGESRRMGRDKASLSFDGRALVVRICDRLASVSDDVFVVAKSDAGLASLGVRMYHDRGDVKTPLMGIVSALRVAVHPYVFVCATDMPHVSRDLVELLTARTSGADAVVPERDGRLEPLHAVWSTSIADLIAGEVDAGERAVHRVLARSNVRIVHEDEWRTVDPSGVSFTNLNTPDDVLAAARR